MVQVDVFWAYGFGASLAAGCAQQLKDEDNIFETKQFSKVVVFLSLFWAPTGMLLLLKHPSWETMQVARDFAHMSPWLVLGFGMTNITQGILGFWVGHQLARRGRNLALQLNWLFGYFGMFFILLYGWDGLGYDRFLYDRDMLPGSPTWTAGAGTADGVLTGLINFVTSSVMVTLLIDGVWLLPPFIAIMSAWHRQSARRNNLKFSQLKMTSNYLACVFGIAFGSAAICAVTVAYTGALLGVGDNIQRSLGAIPPNTEMHILSYVLGLPLALSFIWFALLKPGRPLHRLLGPQMLMAMEAEQISATGTTEATALATG